MVKTSPSNAGSMGLMPDWKEDPKCLVVGGKINQQHKTEAIL